MSELLSYPEYRGKWLQEHPSSVPPKPKAALTPRWLKVAILVVFLASAIVSGSHTVPTIAETILFEEGTLIDDLATQQLIAILGFVMVECATFVAAYMSVLHAGKRRKLLRIVLFFTMTVAISGNLYSTTKALAVNGDTPFLTLITAGALGLGAPTIALLMGEIFAQVKVEDDDRVREAKDEYQTALKRLDAAILQAHQKYIKDTEAKLEALHAKQEAERKEEARLAREEAARLSQEEADRQARLASERLSAQTQTPDRQEPVSKSNQTDDRHSGFGFNRTSDGKQQVVEYLKTHPEHVNLSLRELGGVCGVNKDTAGAGKRLYLQSLGDQEPTAIAVIESEDE